MSKIRNGVTRPTIMSLLLVGDSSFQVSARFTAMCVLVCV